jgi:hypothetical protein
MFLRRRPKNLGFSYPAANGSDHVLVGYRKSLQKVATANFTNSHAHVKQNSLILIPLPVMKLASILYIFKFPALFCELGLKMLGRQQWQLLLIEKDEQVIRLGKHKLHNNTKTWRANICEVALELS